MAIQLGTPVSFSPPLAGLAHGAFFSAVGPEACDVELAVLVVFFSSLPKLALYLDAVSFLMLLSNICLAAPTEPTTGYNNYEMLLKILYP